MSLRHLPNLICVARIALVLPIAMLLHDGRYQFTLALFAVAAVSDAVDGFLAKHFGWTSELGKFLDPLADKLLLVTVFIMLAVTGLTPLWLAAVVVGRDVVIGLGSLAFLQFFGPLHGRPTVVSKVNTAVQLVYVLAVVAGMGFAWPIESVALFLGAAVFVTTVVSGMDYVSTYVRRAMDVVHARRLEQSRTGP